MVTLSLGTKKRKFNSIKAAWLEATKVQPELKYITFYARVKAAENKLGLGWKVTAAMKQPVRKYQRKHNEQVAA